MIKRLLAVRQSHTLPLLLGNTLEHFDKSLYGLLAPFIAMRFFRTDNILHALCLIYLPFGIIYRPLGAWFFGRIGDRLSRKKALSCALLGMSFMTMLIGLLPTYEQAGIWSPILLSFSRGMLSFFAAGEATGASLLLLEGAENAKRNWMSSFYEMSGMWGVLLGSLSVFLLVYFGKVNVFWRGLFIIGGVAGYINRWIRQSVIEECVEKKVSIEKKRTLLAPFITIALVTGFAYANYRIVMTMLNGYLPAVCKVSSTWMLMVHVILVGFDLLLFPLFAWLADRISKERVMIIALALVVILAFPLFQSFSRPTLWGLFVVRFILVVLGVAVGATYQNWAQQLVPYKYRYRVIGMSKAFGAECIGGPTVSFSLWLYGKTGWVASPAFYLTFTAILAISAVFYSLRLTRKAALSIDV